jgi:myo-inositol-1(or 4)-monophosphatase
LLPSTSPRPESMKRELDTLTHTIRLAGARILELATSGFEVQTKKDRSPVTTADLEADRILHDMQRSHFPDDGWLSEETPDNPCRLTQDRVWIVDPIDGTKAYVNRLPEFCISVALVEQGRPVVAAIFNPSTDELFTAVRGNGLSLNGRPAVFSAQQGSPPCIIVSPWELRSGRWTALDALVQCRPMLSIANALALVAAGRIQAAMTLDPENEWDLAAGALLIEESGGTIADAEGKPLTFNQPTPRLRGVIAVSVTASQELRQLLHSHAQQARTKKERP